MRVLPRFLLGVGFLVLLLAIGLFVLGEHFMAGTVPSYSGSARVAGISAPVDIDRDEYAIPHIHAATERDAYFGLGYAEAQDRMFQMEFTRRLGAGRMSEIFGKRTLALDKWARTIGFSRIADQMWLKASPRSRDVLTAFSTGINQYLHQRRSQLGFEFDALKLSPEDWRPQDCMILGRLMSWEMNFSYMTDAAFSDFAYSLDSAHMKSLFPDYPDDGSTAVDGADPKNFVSNYLAIAKIPDVAIGPRATLVSATKPVALTTLLPSPATGTKTTIATQSAGAKQPAAGARPTAVTRPAVKTKPKAQPPIPFIKRPPPVPQGHPKAPPPKPHIPPPPRGFGATDGVLEGARSFFAELHEVQREVDSLIGWPAQTGAAGSNAIALAPSRTATGGAILQNDTHLKLGAPARWYIAHLSSDDGLNVAGFLVPGLPLVLAGRNADISWGVTNAMADECDFFVEKLDSTGERYLLPNGTAQKFTIIHEKIMVQDSAKTGPMQTVPFDILQTNNGPILTTHPDSLIRTFEMDARAGGIPDSSRFVRAQQPVAMMWNGLYALSDEMSGWVNLPRAKSIQEARASLANFATPCLNLCLADARGNIAYQYIGRMPRRSGSEERNMLPRDATNPADAWTGFIYMRDLPSVSNPARGYIVSANNPPVRNRAFAFGNNWEPSSRADRISELIERGGRLDTAAIAHIQMDVVSPYDLRRVLQYLLALYPDRHPPRLTADSTSLLRLDSMVLYWKEDSIRKHGSNVTDSGLRLVLQKDSIYLASRRSPEDTVKVPKLDPFTAQVIDYLRNWDGGMRTDEIAPAIYSVFLNRLLYHTYHDELGAKRYSEFIYLGNIALESLARILPDSANVWWDDVTTNGPVPEHRDSIIKISFRESLRILAASFGRDIRTWQWGRMHTLVYRHPFDKQSEMVARLVDINIGAAAGGPTSPLQATYDLWKPYEMQVGPSMRMIADMKSNDLLASLPTGNSEAVFGDHYRDMVEMFKAGNLVRISLTERKAEWKRFELKPQ